MQVGGELVQTGEAGHGGLSAVAFLENWARAYNFHGSLAPTPTAANGCMPGDWRDLRDDDTETLAAMGFVKNSSLHAACAACAACVTRFHSDTHDTLGNVVRGLHVRIYRYCCYGPTECLDCYSTYYSCRSGPRRPMMPASTPGPF